MLRVAHAAWADAQAGGKLTTEWSEGTFPEGLGIGLDKLCIVCFSDKNTQFGGPGGGLLSTPKLTLSRRLKPATLSPIISNPVQGHREIVWPHTPLSAWGVGEEKRDRNGGTPDWVA